MTEEDRRSRREGSSDAAGSGGELSTRLRRIAGSYHAPPPTPREEIWATIEGGLADYVLRGTGAVRRTGRSVGTGTGRSSRAGRDRLVWTGRIVAAVALVALGFGAGRLSSGADGSSAGEAAYGASDGTTTTAATEGMSSAVEEQALDYLTRSGTLLASVRSDAREGVAGPGVGLWGRGLLRETRVMLDSPASRDPAMRALLEDLELVLAQVAVLSDRERVGEARGREELRLIARGLDRRELLPRIYAILPTGTDLRMDEGDR